MNNKSEFVNNTLLRYKIYKESFGNDVRKSQIHMAYWAFRNLFTKEKCENLDECDFSEEQNGKLSIGFRIGGGMGDFLIFANYLYHFKNKYNSLENLVIDVYFASGFSTSSHIFHEGDLCNKYYAHDDSGYEHKYDVFIELSRYPKLLICDMEKVARLVPELVRYLLNVEKFKLENPRFFDYAGADGQSAIFSEYQGKKRIQQPDIYSILDISEEYKYPLFIDENEGDYLNRIGLINKKYITVHRGCDTQYATHVKMWSIQNYERLVALIKDKYPNIIIVQYGVNEDRCPPIKGVDMNIVGQTTMEQVKVLLKNSLLHIDSDGGMIHLRHALHGGTSLAMYGPNYENFFGYSENINITGEGCSHFCDWLTDDWMLNCARGFGEPPCLSSITPEFMFKQFEEFMKSQIKEESFKC